MKSFQLIDETIDVSLLYCLLLDNKRIIELTS